MWPLTGGCHVANSCTKYRSKCGQCPALSSNNKLDLSTLSQFLKRKLLPNNIHFVGQSDWITHEAKLSSLLSSKSPRFITISNLIDTDLFCPGDKSEIRALLGIPQEKKLICVGALNL